MLSASMDLRWFPPREAQRLLQRGLETKLLESHGGTIRPAFDVSSVDVPLDYTPTSAILETTSPASEDVFLGLVDAIAARTGSDRRSTIASINAIQERLDVEIEVAGLIAARQAGVDVGPFLGPVKARLGMPD